MILTAERDGEIIEFGRDFDLGTAYDFILERDSDPENPWLPDYKLVVTADDDGRRLVLCMDCWCPEELA